MRTSGLTVLALAAVWTLAQAASARADGLYLTPKIGYSRMIADLQASAAGTTVSESNGGNQASLGLAVGYDFKRAYDLPLRLEYEYVWRGKKELVNNADEKGKFGAQSSFVNAYFDIYNPSPVTPYIGAGLGFAVVSVEYEVPGYFSYSETKANFAWNIGAGVAWKISDSVALDLGYRYADFGNAGTSILGVDLDADLTAKEVLLGLRYTF